MKNIFCGIFFEIYEDIIQICFRLANRRFLLRFANVTYLVSKKEFFDLNKIFPIFKIGCNFRCKYCNFLIINVFFAERKGNELKYFHYIYLYIEHLKFNILHIFAMADICFFYI